MKDSQRNKNSEYSILKIDIDVKMTPKLLNDFIFTRKKILEALNFTVIDIKHHETRHGYHFWFIIDKQLQVHRQAEIQFLLGDDHRRCFYNFIRAKNNVFHDFNALFSKKVDNYEENSEERP